MPARPRVLVIDDSRTVREHIKAALDGSGELEVVGEASDGDQALALCRSLRPDVITLDMVLPTVDGVQVTEQVMALCPTPILIVSASTNRGELYKTYDALQAGAVDVLDKPSGSDTDLGWESRLVAAVKMVSRIKVITHIKGRYPVRAPPAISPAAVPGAQIGPSHNGRCQLIALGASTGGPSALVEVISALPKAMSQPVLFVLHLDAMFEAAFADWLSERTGRRVLQAVDRTPLASLSGKVVMARPGRHLVVRGGRLALTDDSERHSCRPSVDVLFESVAQEYGPAAAGCLMTGMGKDGAEGLLAIRRAGGATFAQDEATSVVYGMPREAVLLGAVERTLPLSELGPALGALTGVGRG
jgi:two-component system, chemotaxis family, protein-glutamate methylesterase/glutaminase